VGRTSFRFGSFWSVVRRLRRISLPSQTQSGMQSATRSFSADHMMLWLAFTMKLATWSKRTSTRAISKAVSSLVESRQRTRSSSFFGCSCPPSLRDGRLDHLVDGSTQRGGLT